VALPALTELAFWIGMVSWFFYDPSTLADAVVIVSFSAFVVFSFGMGKVYHQQQQAIWRIYLFPYSAWKVAGLLRSAARDLERGTRTQWGGKSYTREAQA
jgi:hypothetical protein